MIQMWLRRSLLMFPGDRMFVFFFVFEVKGLNSFGAGNTLRCVCAYEGA